LLLIPEIQEEVKLEAAETTTQPVVQAVPILQEVQADTAVHPAAVTTEVVAEVHPEEADLAVAVVTVADPVQAEDLVVVHTVVAEEEVSATVAEVFRAVVADSPEAGMAEEELAEAVEATVLKVNTLMKQIL
jgi:hypothetical protein